MKKSMFNLLAAATLLAGLVSCNKDEDLQPDGLPADAVRVTASIGNPFVATRSNPVGTVEEQAMFNNADKILVSDNNNASVVLQFDGSKWFSAEGKFLRWDADIKSFEAFYPVDSNGNAITIVPNDQSTLEKIAQSDLMWAGLKDVAKGTVLNLAMQRQTSRVIVKIDGFKPEFPVGTEVTDVKLVSQNENPTGPATIVTDYNPYVQGDGKEGSTYTLLVSRNNMPYIYVSLKVGNKEMKTAFLPSGDHGKSYTYNLVVGKEKVEIVSFVVEDWSNSAILPGGEAI